MIYSAQTEQDRLLLSPKGALVVQNTEFEHIPFGSLAYRNSDALLPGRSEG